MDYPRIDAYSDLRSPVHRFDPRAKIISFSALIFSFAFLKSIEVAGLALIFSIFLLLLSRLPFRFVFGRLKVPFVFISMVLAVLAFTGGGDELISILGIGVSLEGLKLGVLIALRAAAAVLLALVMLGTSRFETIIKALHMLKVPNVLVQMLMFTYRYIFVFLDEFMNMKNSMESKGFRVQTNRHGLSVLGNAIGMLLINSYERADRVYKSMVARGYSGNPRLFTAFCMNGRDYALSFFLLGVAVLFHFYPVIL